MATIGWTAWVRATGRALGAFGVVVLATGCGSSARPAATTGNTSAARPVTRAGLLAAIAATRAVPSAHENLTLALAGQSGSLHFTVDGTADFRTTTGTTTVISSQGQREQAVFSAGTVWLTDNAPAFTRMLPRGQRWVRASVAELESIGAFSPLSHSLAILDVLRGVTSLRATGPGMASFQFSLPQALAATPAADRPALQNAIHVNGSPDVREVGSVALTPGGIVRSLSVVIAGQGASSGLFLGYSLTISGVGARVHVTPPASSTPLSSVPRLATLLRGSATGT